MAKKIKRTGELEVGATPVPLAIPGYPGMRATLTITGLDGAMPALDLNGLGAASMVRTWGSKAFAKKVPLVGEGPYEVMLSEASGVGGKCAYVIKAK